MTKVLTRRERQEQTRELLFYEFWSFGVRSARIQEEFAKRRQAVQDALAETLDRLAATLGCSIAVGEHG